MPRSRWPALIGLTLTGAGLLIGITILALGRGDRGPARIEGLQPTRQLYGGIPQEGDVLGADDAKVTVSIFNDLQCASCDEWAARTTPRLVEDLVRPGEAKLGFRHFSLSPRTKTVAALGATAAGEQGREWEFIELFFRNQERLGPRGVTESFLRRIADTIPELELGEWRRDFKDPATAEEVESDADLARDLRLTAEPAVLVQGPRGQRKLTDSPSVSEIERAVEQVR